MRDEFYRPTQPAFPEHARQCKKSAIPPSIMKHAEGSSGPIRRRRHLPGLTSVQRERLIDHDVVTGRQRRDSERMV